MEGSDLDGQGFPTENSIAYLCSHVKRLPTQEPMPNLFGAKLQYLRVQDNMAQAELARHLLASRAHINNMEAGRRAPSLTLVGGVADLFKVATDYLLQDSIPVEMAHRYAVKWTTDTKSSPHLFGVKLRHLRGRHNVSQIELARQLGLASRAYISNLEAGRKEPSIELVLQLSEQFHVTIDYLVRDAIPLDALTRE
jgi:transcriptional regulator with XRE-family HTH domain